jgi:DNA adenine methylase
VAIAEVPTAAELRRYPSPLRYPGGKGKVANFIKLLFLQNDLVGHEYVEPYAGGASVALSLLFEDFASHIHINDIDRSVHAFWRAVLDDTDGLCRRIVETPLTVDQWLHERGVQTDADAEPLDLAFSTFVLNRANRSGIINQGGVIGGLDQTGPWKLDARYNREALVRRINKIARFRTRITLTNLDAAELLIRWTTGAESPAMLYLDPPYYVKGAELYQNWYDHDDHVAIASLVRRLQHPWVVSYDAVSAVTEMYRRPKTTMLRYGLQYSARERHAGDEVMFFSKRLAVPRRESPAGIPMEEVDEARHLRLLA